MTWPSVWDAFTAIGTVAMAVTTAAIIYQNRRQHRDGLRPFCILVPESGLEQFARAEVVEPHEEPNKPVSSYYLVKGGVKNVGSGPAVHLRLMICFPMNPVSKGLEPTLELPPLGAGQQLESPILLPVRLHDRFNISDFRSAATLQWELWLEYQDMFGNTFHTMHLKDPQRPWCVIGKGPAPFSHPMEASA